ncbi:MAG: acetyl-CoA carboxylase carboxyltransferase subunit alpha [Candidatus Omnitrophica bacterium]|nr:acetyl-CoA carboxylase carboxyltransferase subunit alpha [Candidatus Omnitrophota bacterium]
MISTGLDFEKPIVELERKIEELKKFSSSEKLDIGSEIKKLEEKLEHVKREVFENLTPWQKVQIARHPKRPYTLDYIGLCMSDFVEIHGDRRFADDKALITGLARIDSEKIAIIGHQKGRDTKENLLRNFGSAHPEGYRKALRVMELAARHNVPIVCFVDTPGAYPGIGAEERGQAEAIAYNLQEMFKLRVPVIVIVIGEGGSGGALGIGIGDRIAVLENSYYSVISPEGCAAILWKDRKKAPEAAGVLKLTGEELLKLGLIDEIIREPLGGAHRDWEGMAKNLKAAVLKYLSELKEIPADKLTELRYAKFRRMGVFSES